MNKFKIKIMHPGNDVIDKEIISEKPLGWKDGIFIIKDRKYQSHFFPVELTTIEECHINEEKTD